MAIIAAYENTATIGTVEYSLPNNSTTLTPITVDGVYQVFIDLAALTLGDVYVLNIYERVVNAGTQRLVSTSTVGGPLLQPHYVTPSLILLHGWDVTLKKSSGTDRSIGWSIRQVA